MVTPSSPSPYCPRRYFLTNLFFFSSCWTAARSTPVPLPWLMKAALSGLPAREAGAGTGTYGLFRDLAAPFGVAVFVPLFTNRITGLAAGGVDPAAAAVCSIHGLAAAELLCVAVGILVVFFLPGIHNKGETT